MASKAAAQIRQGSVGLGQRQEERWDKCKAKEKEERGRKSTEAGGPTTNCSGRPSLSKGGTHRATGPVIIVVFKKVGSTAFSATSRGRKSPITCGVGMGELCRHNFEIREESKGKEKDRRDEKGKGTEKGGEAWGNHQTLGEPVWLTRSKVDPPKSDKSKDCNQKKRESSKPVWLTGRPTCHLMRR